MTVVFVHGNPEVAAIWNSLVAKIKRTDVVCVSLPGFGAPIPSGFECTPTGYQGFLAAAIAELDGPVDLVGHDIGGSTTIELAMSRPDLLHSWVSDSVGVFEPEYEWHELARGWQTPNLGEASVAEWTGGDIHQKRALARGLGATGSVVNEMAAAFNENMAHAILEYYRSAVQPVMADLGQGLSAAAARPGLALIPTNDRFVGSVESRQRAALRAGASIAELPGLGHRWMLIDAELSAHTLETFWASLS